MTHSHLPAIERIARVLAGQRLSINAEGSEPSAAPDVDDAWPTYRDDAIAVLKTLREPDEAMARSGDVEVWQRMVASALGDEAPAGSDDAGWEAKAPGTDPLHEGP